MIRKLLYSFLSIIFSNASKKKSFTVDLRLLCLGMFFVVSFVNTVEAQIWSNPITGANPSASNPYTTGQSVASNLSVSGIGRANVLGAVNAGNIYAASGWTNSNNINTNNYFEFTLTPNAGYEIDFTNFIYTGTNTNGPTRFALRSSLDNYLSNIGTSNSVGGTFDLSTYQNIASPITFRLYGYRNQNGGNFSVNDFEFNGSISCSNNITATGVTICQGGSGTISYGVGSTSLSGNTLTGSWNLGTDPVAYRPGGETTGPFNDTSTCLFISSEAKRSYVATTFQVSVTGNYTFKMTDSGAYDGIGYIYTGNFTPGDCAGGGAFVRGDDDDGAVGTEPKMVNVPLVAGTTYTLISTQFNLPAVNANFTWTITPPSGGGLITPSWYTTATSTSPITSVSPFNPVLFSTSGLTNTNTPGTTTYYVSFPSVTGCRTAVNFVINPLPTISGTLGVCVGFTTQLTGSATAAASTPWTSSLPAVATVSNTGLVTGVAAGTSVITYKNSNGCTQTATVTVSPVPTAATISGNTTVCQNSGSPNITFANPQTFPVTVTYNINGGSSTTVNIAASSVANIAVPTTTSGVFVYNLVSVANQSATTCSNAISGSATVRVNSIPTITLNKTDETCASSNNGTITPVLSGGLTNVRYIKLTQKYVNAAAWQQVAEIQAFEIFTGTNVALSTNGASATASSIYSNNPGIYGPQRAIDGSSASIWHSNSTNINEFIIVDLASGKNLDYLRIYNRADCCQERGQNMLLELLDASSNVIYSKTVDLFENIYGSHYIDVNVLDVSWGDPATTLNRTGLDVGTYTLNYSDAVGCSASSQATIATTNPNTSITTQPSVSAICAGSNTSFSVAASGVALTYQWELSTDGGTNFGPLSNGGVYSNVTSATMNITGATALMNGYRYRVVVTGTCSAVTSPGVALTVNSSPTVTSIATPTVLCIGGSLSMTTPTVTANGSAITAQGWQIETGVSSGAYTSLTLPYTVALADDGKAIRYSATSSCGITTSNLVTVTVNDKPTITSISAPAALCTGALLNMTTPTVTANGSAVSAQGWEIETGVSSGLYTGLTLPYTTTYADNSKTIRYSATNSCGTTTSNSVTVTVNTTPTVTSITAPAALCSGVLLNMTTPTVTANGSAVSAQGWQIETGVSSGSYTGLTLPYTTTYADNGKTIRYSATNGCGTTTSNSVTVTVNEKPTVTPITTPTALCTGGSLSMTTPTVTVNGSAVSAQGWQIETGVSSGAYTSLTLPYTVALADDGKTIRYSATSNCGITTSNSVTLKVNANPTAPVASPTQPTCAQPTGTITVSSPAPGAGISYGLDGTTFPNTTGVFTGLTDGVYTVYVKNGSGCIASATPITIASTGAIVWTGNTSTDWNTASNWLPAVVPGLGDCVLIPNTGAKNSVISTDVSVYSISVNNGGSLTVLSDKILTVTEGIIVGTSGSFIFENNSSLIQKSTSNSINIGNITYKRKSAPVRRYDFTFWSSPVKKESVFTLKKLSPLTLADKYYSYNTTTSAWKINNGGTLTMIPGDGYIVRAPQNFDLVATAIYPASFIGTPNNGDIEITPVADHSYLLGNPYPSALNAKEFIEYNSLAGNDVGALYFWTHNSPPSDAVSGDAKYNYTVNDYAVYSLVGGVATGPAKTGGSQPTGVIAAGQAFFATPSTNVKIKFTNDMRIGAGNSQFFKTKGSNETEQNRLWLNFTNAKGAFKQVLVGYVDGATNGWDTNYDGWTMSGNTYLDFYSINDADKLTIQGRALPFEKTDLVPLGYVTSIAGDFTIAIDHADGVFTSQAVYLEDKKTGQIIDLRAGNYTFNTAIGTFPNRFVLRYTNKTLGTGDFENIENGILVSSKDKTIKVQSSVEAIKEVTIFDVAGKLVYNKKKVTSNELQITNLQAANQVLLINITLENGFTTTRKVIFQ
ncbi:T9SS sorting signal type C domain-containing protein [Flavobacterium sp. N2038]|uniref:T9SS sorting signal type C domain-containing protein n=1 Tax=Flavobacterium sp. N2038 TaxID=2986829 RepID=UPI002224D01D|nr:T9SS sorting signal type C domain-containing protein [Flavobacterium sp. N2038]